MKAQKEPDPEIMTRVTAPTCLLAGDIGGTKTSLALYRPEDTLLHPFHEKKVNNDTAGSFDEIIENFLQEKNIRPDAACFGVAGPIRNNRVKMTNLDWTLDGPSLQQRFGLRSVLLINDLVATAMGAVHLPADRLLTLNKGQADPVGAIGVIAPGTGLGEAFLIKHKQRRLPIPSEGGHSFFAPTDQQQIRLLLYMAKQHGQVSAEMVCSGIGIPNLHDFLCAEKGVENPLANHPDRTRAIVEAALAALDTDDPHNIARQAIQLFSAILAAESANLALKVLATGGIYIGGGIPPRILRYLHAPGFMDSFARGEYRDMLAAIPVHVILEPATALIGAAAYAFESPELAER
ncbi:MAG: glucokinase [Desulfobulbaceae bacterium]|nr:glucokinase [Desulfobulbaceae bacterium]